MSRRLTEVTTTTLLDHGLFGLFNEDFGEGLVATSGIDEWVTAGRGAILVSSPFNHLGAILRLEEWDGEPGPEPQDGRGPWQDDVVTVSMECSGDDGTIVLNEIAAGLADTGFALSRRGTFHVRLARRNGDAEEQARAAVYASFDEADWNTAAFTDAMEAIDVAEEYLIRFWPHSPNLEADAGELR